MRLNKKAPVIEAERRGNTKNGHPKDHPVAWEESGKPIFGYNSHGQPVCYSRLRKKKGKRCMCPIRYANGRCELHGGGMAVGALASNFKNGIHSIVLKKYAPQIQAALDDPAYLELRNALALNHIRMLAIAEEFDQGIDHVSWESILIMCEGLYAKAETQEFAQNIMALGKDSAVVKWFKEFDKLYKLVVSRGNERRLHKEMSEAAKDRAKLVEVEIKRAALEKNHMPADTVLTLFISIMKVITTNVKDRAVLQAIRHDIDKLALNPNNRKALGGMTMPKDQLMPQTYVAHADEKPGDDPKVIRMVSEQEYEHLLQENKGKNPTLKDYKMDYAALRSFIEKELKHVKVDYEAPNLERVFAASEELPEVVRPLTREEKKKYTQERESRFVRKAKLRPVKRQLRVTLL